MFGKEVYERNLPSVYLINERIEKSEISLIDLPILFKFSWVNGTILSNLNDYFDFEIFIFKFDEEYKITYEQLLHTTNCNFHHCTKIELIRSYPTAMNLCVLIQKYIKIQVSSMDMLTLIQRQ